MSQRTLSSVAALTVAALLGSATAHTAAARGASVPEPTADAPIDAERCAANRDAGTITYLTGFDYAAAASMVEVYVASARGYYEERCLDVEILPSFSTSNYPLVAGGDAQFASAGSFSEVLSYGALNEAELVAVMVDGRSPIDVLIVKPDTVEGLEDLEGATIGVKGTLQPSIAAMLATVGLREGVDYDTVLLDGFDPLAHLALDGIVGFPGYRSNEPGALTRAGEAFDLFDPADHGIPGSFGVTYTSRSFLDEHPTAVLDFVLASRQGLAEAIEDPQAAVDVAMQLVTAGGNPNYLSVEGETYRWTTDAATIAASVTPEAPLAVPVPELLQAEVEAYHAVGLFPDGVPDITDALDETLIAAMSDEGV